MAAKPGAEERVLVLTPSEADGRVVSGILEGAAIAARVCAGMEELARELRAEAGAVVVAEEALGGSQLELLSAALVPQPEWSDFPLVLLTVPGHDSGPLVDRLWRTANSYVAVLERPIRSAALLSTVRMVLQSRRRQYQVRDELKHRREVEAALAKANRRKDEFLATLGHELRHPLAPLATALEVLRRAEDEATLAESAAVMGRQVERLTRLVDDLLDASRISHGRFELQLSRVALSQVMEGAVEATKPLVEEAGHELSVALPGEPIFLDADPLRLEQVLSNLLSNAVKYTPRGGRVELRAEVATGGVRVTVRDDGVGIPRDELGRVFGMFQQLDPALETGFKGLGIGLALSKSLVEMHGGKIEAHSEGRGKGSRFTVWLPAAAETASPEAADGTAPEPGQAPRHRVLVVEDHRDAARMLARLLRMLGNRVEVAHDGLSAVAAAAELRPHLVLLDIGLPELNGYDAARRIRAGPGGEAMVLVAVTGWGQENDRRRAEEAGFDRHVTKPIDLPTLEAVLADVPPHRPEPVPSPEAEADAGAAPPEEPAPRPPRAGAPGPGPDPETMRQLAHDLRGSLNRLALQLRLVERRTKDRAEIGDLVRRLGEGISRDGEELAARIEEVAGGDDRGRAAPANDLPEDPRRAEPGGDRPRKPRRVSPPSV